MMRRHQEHGHVALPHLTCEGVSKCGFGVLIARGAASSRGAVLAAEFLRFTRAREYQIAPDSASRSAVNSLLACEQ